MSFIRFAVYYLPTDKALAAFGATWLGWDIASGRAVAQPDIEGLETVTDTPRKYGFHGTLKPPFRLAEGCTQPALQAALSEMAAACPPAQSEGLALAEVGSFLALTPLGDAEGIGRIAATCVRAIDGFRAAADAADLARRRKAGLSARQDRLLLQWGYPYVMEEFRFHLTLTGRVPRTDRARWLARARDNLPPLPAPFILDEVALVGERADGRFELIQRYRLGGSPAARASTAAS